MIFVARRAPTPTASSADLLRRALRASLSSSSPSSSAAHAGTRSRRSLSSSSSSADDNETDDDVRRSSSSSSSSSRINPNRSSGGDPLDYLRTWVGGGGGGGRGGGGGTPSPSSGGGSASGRLSRRPAPPPTSSHPTSSFPSPSLSSTSSLPPHMRKGASAAHPSGFLSPTSASSDTHQVSRSLVVTGGTYLIPTLRLERSDTPSSLSAGIERALGGVGGGAVRSLLGLRGGAHGGGPSERKDSKKRAWRVPIVLDLSALAPDGSPHYRPPPPGLLSSLVEVLDEYGMRAVGASNLTKGGGGNQTQVEPRTALELESARLGLPRVMTMARSGGSGGGGSPPPAFGIEEVVGMVLARAEEEDDDDDIVANDDSAAVSEMESVVETGEGIVEEDETTDDGEDDDDNAEFSSNDALDVSLPLPSPQEVDNMTFAALRRECRSRGLLSTGNTEALRQRLRKHLSLLEYIAREEEKEGERDSEAAPATASAAASTEGTDEDIDGPDTEDMAAAAASPPPPLPSGATVYRGTVRSGQQVSSDPGSSSLIVIGNVSSGGEVLSDGDIYVLGKLRGRALAGLGLASQSKQRGQGERGSADSTAATARIFASSFDPELVCVGDEFTTVDDVEELGLEREGAAMVSLETTTTIEEEKGSTNGSSGRLRFEKVAL